jgi:undecaprenyl-diphosphatase
MLDQLKSWDTDLLLWFNQFHTPWLDPIVYWVTKTEFWIPLYLLLIYLIFRNYKREGWWIMAGLVLTLVIADMVTYRIMKPLFERLRPSHEPALQSLLHLVNDYRGGLYGFASSHAANTVGVAYFLFLWFRNRYRWIVLMFVWAFIMCYTRIYLGVHYPGDILAGSLVGLLAGWAGYRFSLWLIQRRTSSQSK